MSRQQPPSPKPEESSSSSGNITAGKSENRHRTIHPSESLSIADRVELCRAAQLDWREQSPRRRVAAIGIVSGLLAERYRRIADLFRFPQRREVEMSLASEIMPLADACKFLRNRAARLLASRTLSRSDRPAWMGKLHVRLHREPLGTVLVLGTWNYPLFLPGVQIAQALAAGNGVLFKPSPGTELISRELCQLFWDAGISPELLQLLPSQVDAARQAISVGVDKVILTGSSTTGRALLRTLSETLTPATLELSGCDAMFILPSADLNRACDAIIFGLRLNGSATCIAPRRIFVMPEQLAPLQQRLQERLANSKQIHVHPPSLQLLRRLVIEAKREGATALIGDENIDSGNDTMTPLVMTGVQPSMRLVQSDVFAPVVSLIPVNDWSEAIAADRQCPYALAASIFGNASEAERRSTQIEAGCVVINDLIVPTADPRVPFGGKGESGYGVTRGAEGLLEMTRIKTVCHREGNWLPHLEPSHATDRDILAGLLQFLHGNNLRVRWRGVVQIWRAIQTRRTDKP